MDAKLKALKVADLKAILVQADSPAPAKATKSDLISRILASEAAQDVYRQIHEQPTDTPDASDPPPPPVVEEEQPEEQKPEPEAQPQPVLSELAEPVDPELEARKRRAERFGIPLIEKSQRTGRPKEPTKTKATPREDPEKLKFRAERFGTKRAAPAESIDAEEVERRRKRAERFG